MVVALYVVQRSLHTMDKEVFDRLLKEARELQDKVDALKRFIQYNKFYTLPPEDQYLMESQLCFMEGYLKTLRRRIYINKDKVEE